LGALLLPLGCRTAAVDHPDAVDSLIGWKPSKPAKPSAFESVSALERSGLPESAPGPYRLGVGDVVEVRVLSPTGVQGFETSVVGPVKDDGSLYLPSARRVEALGKTTQELELAVAEKLAGFARDPLVSAEVTAHRARLCRVVGEGVEEEQFLPADGRLTLLQALIKAGATRKLVADREEAYLIRAGKVHPFSIAAMVEQGDPSADFVLAESDHVVVPSVRERKDFVYVFGQVAKPGRIDMDPGRRPADRGCMTLMGAVGMAGGVLDATADCNRICIFRGGYRDVRVFRIGVHELYQFGESIALEPGDRVYVAASDFARFSMGLQQFLPILTSVGTTTALVLSVEALTR
jgi:polysaccharide export outer membrane protein